MAVVVNPDAQATFKRNKDGSQVRIFGVASLAVAKIGAAVAPTSLSDPLTQGWVDLGYLSDNSVTESRNQDTSDIKVYEGVTVATVTTDGGYTIAVELAQTFKATLELYYQNVANESGSIYIEPVRNIDRYQFCLDVAMGAHSRRVYGGQATFIPGDVAYQRDGATVYPGTLTFYPDPNMVTNTSTGSQASAQVWDDGLAVGQGVDGVVAA